MSITRRKKPAPPDHTAALDLLQRAVNNLHTVILDHDPGAALSKLQRDVANLRSDVVVDLPKLVQAAVETALAKAAQKPAEPAPPRPGPAKRT